MKKLYFLMVVILVATTSYGQITELYFSMYGEGSSNNKFLEIYNGTSSTVSLDNYALPSVANEPNTPGEYEYWNTFTVGATIASGDVFVIAHPDADPLILAEADMTHPYLSNGDDGYALVANDGTWVDANSNGEVDEGEMTGFTILDWIGNWDGDPGSGWDVAGVAAATQNHTLTRKTSVCGPNNDWASSAGTNETDSEWIVGDIDSGWGDLGAYTGCTTSASISITSPSNGAEFPGGTTSVDVVFITENAPGGSQVDITVNGSTTTDITSPFSVTTVDGESYSVSVELVDGGVLDSDSVTFSIAFPCELVLGAETAVCDSETSGVDPYTATIEFTGGGTSTYTIDTSGIGTVGGDNPSDVASGTIIVTNIDEGTNLTVNITGDSANSSCDLSTTIDSPLCVGTITCPSVGDVIITEIMQNPSVVGDSEGEWFEVYNTTSAPIDMQGWVLNDSNSDTETHIITASVIVPANGYAVLGNNSDTATNGNLALDYEYSSYYLGNGEDDILLDCNETTIDVVLWDDGVTFPDPVGYSMELSMQHFDDIENDNGANWSEAISVYGDGDYGTPGGQNDNGLSINEVEISDFSIYPNPNNDGSLHITTQNNLEKNIQIFDVLGKQVFAHMTTETTVNISKLKTGIYIIKVEEAGYFATRKLVIE